MAVEPSYPVAAIARLLNLDPRRIQQLAREGIIPKPARGKYPLVGSVQGYVRYLQEAAAGRQPTKEVGERQRDLLEARVEKARLEASKIAGRLISVDEIAAVNERVCHAAATHFRSLGPRLRAELAGISDPALVQKRIDEETSKILEALAGSLVERPQPTG